MKFFTIDTEISFDVSVKFKYFFTACSAMKVVNILSHNSNIFKVILHFSNC